MDDYEEHNNNLRIRAIQQQFESLNSTLRKHIEEYEEKLRSLSADYARQKMETCDEFKNRDLEINIREAHREITSRQYFNNVFAIFEEDIQKTIQQLLTDMENIPKEASRRATDARHYALREFKEKAARVAQSEWKRGSTLLHHQMTKYLIEEYQDEKGKYPFMYLPNKDKNGNPLPPEKVIRETLKQVAKIMNRPDLISGQRKSL